jgi:hypothetical protein
MGWLTFGSYFKTKSFSNQQRENVSGNSVFSKNSNVYTKRHTVKKMWLRLMFGGKSLALFAQKI